MKEVSNTPPKPHIREVSCIDVIFSTQKVILKHIREGDTPYLWGFYLEKGFESVEYSILLSHIFNTSSVVRVNDRRSESIPVKRGVKQGSVLSPTLFIAVIDSLLSFLESSGQGLAIFGVNMGN